MDLKKRPAHPRTAAVVDAPEGMRTLEPVSGFGTYLVTRPSAWSPAHREQP